MRCCFLFAVISIGFVTAFLDFRSKRDIVTAACKRRPDLPYCQNGKSRMEQPSADGASEPFPMGVPDSQQSVAKVKNPFDEISERGAPKKPPQITLVLDKENQEELSKIKTVDPRPWTSQNNWGFESEVRERKRPYKVLIAPSANETSQTAVAADSPTFIPKKGPSPKLKQIYDSLYWVPRGVAVPANVDIPKDDPNRNGLLKDIGSIDVGFNFAVASYPGNDPVSVGAKVGVGFGATGLAGKLPASMGFGPQGEDVSLNDYDGNKALIVPDKARKVAQLLRLGLLKPVNYGPAKQLIGVNTGLGVGHPGK